MGDKMKHIDTGSVIVIIATFVLFLLALFATGLTHDLLLEAGVFLVSVKLIMMSYRSTESSSKILQELEDIKKLLKELDNRVL